MTGSSIGAGPRVGSLLPDLALPTAPDGRLWSFRARGRQGRVAVLLHSSTCEGCLAYLDSLAANHQSLVDWDGRVVAVLPEDLARASDLRRQRSLPFTVMADPEGLVTEALGMEGGSILIADQWGEIFLAEAGHGEQHAFLPPEEVAEWLRFVAIQCPECQGEAL